MALIDRFNRWFRQTSTPARRTTTAEMPRQVRPTEMLERLRVERDRRGIIKECRRMEDEDTRASNIHRTLAQDLTRGGFRVVVERGVGAARARAEAQALIERLGLEEAVTDWVKHGSRDGDAFLEVAVDDAGDIVRVQRLPTLTMHRHSDVRDEFPDPLRAFWQADELWSGMEPPSDAVWFAEWQIIHARWDPDPERRYGRPLLASGRKAFKRMDEGEFDVAVRRKTRAGIKYVHILEGANPDEVEAYKEQNQEALDNPFAAIADFFINKKGGVEVIQGDGKLGELADIQHHIGTFFMGSPVPSALLGYGENLNRDVLDEQKEQYDRALDGLTASYIDQQILQPLIELQWLLKGILPSSLRYRIVRPPRQPITAPTVKAAGEAAQALKATGVVVDALILRVLGQLIPGFDADEATQLLQQHREEQASRPGGTSGEQKILGYHIEENVVSRDEARASIGLAPEGETLAERLRQLETMVRVAQGLIDAKIPPLEALRLTGLAGLLTPAALAQMAAAAGLPDPAEPDPAQAGPSATEPPPEPAPAGDPAPAPVP